MAKYNINNVKFFTKDKRRYVTINQCGVEATYPFDTPATDFPVKAVMMDLDGTTVKSEEFWVYLIQKTIRKLTSNPEFTLADEDLPFVSGFSTAEHLSYCLKKYNFPYTIAEADNLYHKTAEYELNEIMEGRGNVDAFRPRDGIKDFLLTLKANGVKIGLATSGLDYKAIPEIVSTFRVLGMGNPTDFYDAIITGGKRKQKGNYGTIGELAVKPHPWIYKELALGLGVNADEAIVVEDSSAGLISGRTAGFNVVGFADGNLRQSGLANECFAVVNDCNELLRILGL